MTDNRSPQGAALPAWARAARPIALAAWALAALAPGAAVALAQDASLAHGQQLPLNTVAGLILWLGLGLALLGWVFWAVVRIRLQRTGYHFGLSTARALTITIRVFFGSIGLVCAGGVLALAGGISSSQALPALVGLGLGVAGAVGGVPGDILVL